MVSLFRTLRVPVPFVALVVLAAGVVVTTALGIDDLSMRAAHPWALPQAPIARWLAGWLYPGFAMAPVLSLIATQIVVVVASLSLNQRWLDLRMTDRGPALVPSLLIFLVLNLAVQSRFFGPDALAFGLFVPAMIMTTSLDGSPRADARIFRIGLLWSLAALVHHPALLWGLALVPGLVLYTTLIARRWIFLFMGMSLPWIYLLSALYLFDRPIALPALAEQMAVKWRTPSWPVAAAVLFVAMPGLVAVALGAARWRRAERTFFRFVLWVLVAGIGILILDPLAAHVALLSVGIVFTKWATGVRRIRAVDAIVLSLMCAIALFPWWPGGPPL